MTHTASNLAINIREMRDEGHSDAAILEYVTSAGVEFPDASELVRRVLKLDHEAQLEMEENYN